MSKSLEIVNKLEKAFRILARFRKFFNESALYWKTIQNMGKNKTMRVRF